MKKSAASILVVVVQLALGLIADAQQQAKIPKIGYLLSPAPAGSSARFELLLREFRKLGYVEGKNIAFESRYVDDKLNRLSTLAEELVLLKVDVILTPGINAALAAKKATRMIPIVCFNLSDPVVAGLVDSLARPGGSITGFTNIGPVRAGKRLEVLKETVPKLSALRCCGIHKLHAIMERKPTPGTRTGLAASFHRGQQHR